MQDILLEPYGGQILGLSVGQTTALTALLAAGGLMGFLLAAHVLGRGADPYRIAALGTLVGIVAAGYLVYSGDVTGTVVAFGDSITDGVNSSVGGNDRWPDDLARRLGAVAGPTLSVADEGIGGNRLLTASRCCGASAQARFARDALDQPGVRDVIVLEGINDIGTSVGPRHLDTGLTPARMIAGYRDLIVQAHARGVRIFGATLLPYHGAGYYSPAGEAIREAVNAWIRTSGAFDGVVDFDAAMRDPADPLRLNPAYDSGDHLHPNDAGYQAMADAISLDMLLPRQGSAA